MQIENFDVISYFEDKQYDYHTAGEKNVTNGWVNIECPFPNCYDPSWHCGINLESLLFNCYNCGNKGNILSLIQEIEKCGFGKAKSILKLYSNTDFYRSKQLEVRSLYKMNRDISIHNILPKQACDNFDKKHLNYLKNRGFNPVQLISKYKLKMYGSIGKWKFRIIIPVFFNRQIVTFTSRSIIDSIEPKYKHQFDNKSIIPIKDTLYNFDNIPRDKVIITEGVTDVWKLGNGAIATYGYNVGKNQIDILKSRNFKDIFIIFDSEDKAKKRAISLANNLGSFHCNIEQIDLSCGDPGDMDFDSVLKLRKELNFGS